MPTVVSRINHTMKKIYVVGSSNTDMVVRCDRLPKPGETVLGGRFIIVRGGKGANQAVAAARLGGDVTFLCRVGNDTFGKESLAAYKREGINTEPIIVDGSAPSGVALIVVDKKRGKLYHGRARCECECLSG